MEYFIKVQEPKKLRISLMTAARDSVIMISMLESFSEMRAEKTELMLSLREDFREMNLLCKQMSELIADDKTRKDIIDAIKNAKEEKIRIAKQKAKLDIDIANELKKSTKAITKIVEAPKIKEQSKQIIREVREEKEEPAKEERPVISFIPKEKNEVDRLEYTLAQIEKKLADLQK